MLRRFALSVAVALFVSSGAFAQVGAIDHYQDFTVGLDHILDLLHGHGHGSVVQHISVHNTHRASAPSPTRAEQRQSAELGQRGTARGEASIISVNQFLDAWGNQDQHIGVGVALKTQTQTLGLDGAQVLFRSDGQGGAGAVHTAELGQTQIGSSARGMINLTETSSINGSQTSNLGGGPTSTGTLASSMTATTFQTQAVY